MIPDKVKQVKNENSSGDLELMRFGHSVTLSKNDSVILLVNKQQAVLFGGAKGTSSKYQICNDTYLFKNEEHMWVKLNRKSPAYF